MLKTFSITVSGLVQGVYYRQHTLEKAAQLHITGFTSNIPDGTVQIIATGPAEKLQELVAWCRKGPPGAMVTRVEVKELPLQHFGQFIIKR